MWLLGIAVIIIAAAIVVNLLVKWLNRRQKKPPVPDWDQKDSAAHDTNFNRE